MNDAIVMAAILICIVAFDADAWNIATMQAKYCCLGLRLPTDVALHVHLASTAVSTDLADRMLSTSSYLDEDEKRAHWNSTIFPVSNKHSIQYEWDTIIIRHHRNQPWQVMYQMKAYNLGKV